MMWVFASEGSVQIDSKRPSRASAGGCPRPPTSRHPLFDFRL